MDGAPGRFIHGGAGAVVRSTCEHYLNRGIALRHWPGLAPSAGPAQARMKTDHCPDLCSAGVFRHLAALIYWAGMKFLLEERFSQRNGSVILIRLICKFSRIPTTRKLKCSPYTQAGYLILLENKNQLFLQRKE